MGAAETKSTNGAKPTILVPYQRMALDLVGPLNRTVKGYRYISTVMCLGTRNPYAVALKKIDAEL